MGDKVEEKIVYGVKVKHITSERFQWRELPNALGVFFGYMNDFDGLHGRISVNHEGGFGYSAMVFDGSQIDFEKRGKIGKYDTFDEARKACEDALIEASTQAATE